jgi:hypothetical protein
MGGYFWDTRSSLPDRRRPFESAGAEQRDSESEPSSVPPAQRSVGKQASSTVLYRSNTLVYIKPAQGSLEQVFLGQLLEPVVEVQYVVRRRGKERASLKFAVQNPRIRYFMLRGGEDDSGIFRYEHDRNSSTTVNAAAIYGRVEDYTNDVSSEGLLQAFDVEQEDLDRMEGTVNEQLDQSSSEDSDAEVETEALQRLRKNLQQAKSLHNVDVLPAGATRSRVPTRRHLDEVRYNEVRGR